MWLMTRHSTWSWRFRIIHELDIPQRIPRLPLSNAISLYSVVISDIVEYTDRCSFKSMARDPSFWNLSCCFFHYKYNSQRPCGNFDLMGSVFIDSPDLGSRQLQYIQAKSFSLRA